MNYLGGKARVCKPIGQYLSKQEFNGTYFEPFCGGLWVTGQVKADIKIVSDANEALITLHKAIQEGWEPPGIVTEEEYNIIKEYKDLTTDPLVAFVGFGCSFGAKWFGGYARGSNPNYAGSAKTSLLKKFESLQEVIFFAGDYIKVMTQIQDMLSLGCLIYCDPPYVNTTHYGAVPRLDPFVFWNTMREWSRRHQVFISEYLAPPDFECVLAIPTKLSVRSKDGCADKIEKLFKWKGQTCVY